MNELYISDSLAFQDILSWLCWFRCLQSLDQKRGVDGKDYCINDGPGRLGVCL